MWIFLLAIFLVVLALVAYVIILVNFQSRLKRLWRPLDSEWEQVVMRIKKRNDLIPGFTYIISASLTRPEPLLEQVNDYRLKSLETMTQGPMPAAVAEKALNAQLEQLMNFAAEHADLVAAAQFQQQRHLVIQLTDDLLARAQEYNTHAQAFNHARNSLLGKFFAGRFGFHRDRELFLIPEIAQLPSNPSTPSPAQPPDAISPASPGNSISPTQS